MAEKKEKEQKESEIQIVQVPTQMGLAFKVPDKEEPITSEEYLVWLGEQVYKIKKAVA